MKKDIRIWLTDNKGTTLGKEELNSIINKEFNLFLNMEVNIEYETIIKKVKRNLCICNWWAVKEMIKYIKNFIDETEQIATKELKDKIEKYQFLEKYL